MAKGYIYLHRQIWSDELWYSEPFTKSQAWIDLLLMANYDDNGIYKRGCVYTSVPILAKRWKWSPNKVRRFLKYLESDTKVHTNGTANGTTITIVNYGKFQKKGNTNDTTKSTTSGTLIINKRNTPPSQRSAEEFEPSPFGEDPLVLLERWKKEHGD